MSIGYLYDWHNSALTKVVNAREMVVNECNINNTVDKYLEYYLR